MQIHAHPRCPPCCLSWKEYPPSETTSSLALEALRKKLSDSNIEVMLGDVGNLEDCQRIFNYISDNLPPLRGIMHAAGSLSDGMIENLEWSDFEKTYKSKVNGTWNLHELTKDIMSLEHFVLFSSITAKLGALGQSTHVSACAFEDAMAHYRRSRGLAATSMNWGQWAEVGVAKYNELQHVRPFTVEQGINALDYILRKNLGYVTVAELSEQFGTLVGFHQYLKWIADEKLKEVNGNEIGGNSGKRFKLSSAQFLEEYDKCGDSKEEKLKVTKKVVEGILRNVLRMDSDDKIDENGHLTTLGLDSLMMLELSNQIQTICGERAAISSDAIKECKSLKALAERLVEIFEEKWNDSSNAASAAEELPEMEKILELSLNDAILPEDIKVEYPASQVKPSEIKHLLLTGATGRLGSHLLKELLQSFPQLEIIVCLMRGENPEKRLKASLLEKYNIELKEEDFRGKVYVISGDFALPFLGLSHKMYFTLSGEIDAVFHSGALVSHAEHYRNVERNANKDIRSVNVGSLLNILRFACKTKTKHVFHASTLSIMTDSEEDGTLQETWPGLEILKAVGTSMGYPISKIVNELHLKEATEVRGIPCKVFRYPDLRGSSTSGKSFVEGSHLMKMGQFGLKEGVFPEEPLSLAVMPVDLAAKITTKIMFNDKAPNEVYNVSHPKPELSGECLPKIAEEFGYLLTPVKFEEFAERVLQRCSEAKKEFAEDGDISSLRNALVFEFQNVYKDKTLSEYFTNYGKITFEKRMLCEDYWVSKKLSRFAPVLYSEVETSSEILKRDILAAFGEGILEML